MEPAKLAYFPGSPFARMARILVIEWGLPVTPVEWSFPPPPELFALNPLGQVPALVLPDGTTRAPTLIVLEALWDMAEAPKAAYDPARDRQTLLTILQAGDAVVASLYQKWAGLEPVGLNLVGYDPGARNLERFDNAMGWAEARVSDGTIAGGITLPGVALAAILLWLEVRGGPDWRHRPGLARLVDELSPRASFEDTRPQPWSAWLGRSR